MSIHPIRAGCGKRLQANDEQAGKRLLLGLAAGSTLLLLLLGVPRPAHALEGEGMRFLAGLEAPDGKPVSVLQPSFSADGRRILASVSSAGEKSLRVWDFRTGKELARLGDALKFRGLTPEQQATVLLCFGVLSGDGRQGAPTVAGDPHRLPGDAGSRGSQAAAGEAQQAPVT
jgi:hypothetical protein